MKIKFTAQIIALFIGLMVFAPVGAQPPHACGTISSMSVTYDRDAAGFMPRMKEGSQAQFDCIAARDPNFSVQRFASPIKAMNYWLFLLGQEWGVNMLLLPELEN